MTSPQGQADFSDALRLGNHQGAGEWLVRSFAPEVFGLCLAIVQDRAAAEDLSQEVFASAFAALAGFRGDASARTWILKIARNRCIDYLRKRKRWSGLDEEGDPDEVAEEVSLPSAILSRRSEIELALHELEEVERALIVLRFSHGLDYEELAAAFGIKSGTTRMRVSRALAKMRDFLLNSSRAQSAVRAPEAIGAVAIPESASRARTVPMPAATPPPPDQEPELSQESAVGGAAPPPARQAPAPSSPRPSSTPPAQSSPPPRSAPPAQSSPPPSPSAPPAGAPRAPSSAPPSGAPRSGYAPSPPPLGKPSQSAPGSFSLPPQSAPPAPAQGHVLQSYFKSEEAWLSINLQVRLREMAEQLPAS